MTTGQRTRAASSPGLPGGSLHGYGLSMAAVIVAVAATFALRPWMGTSVSILFFPAVIVAAMYGGYGPSLLATFLSSCALAYFSSRPPRRSTSAPTI